jgi:hypothetical protein
LFENKTMTIKIDGKITHSIAGIHSIDFKIEIDESTSRILKTIGNILERLEKYGINKVSSNK